MHKFDEVYYYTKSLSVLFVEDDKVLRAEVGGILEDFFSTVVYAGDGKEGFVRYKEFLNHHATPFDIVITDIQMPVENGMTLIEHIVAILPDQPIIVVSAFPKSHYLLDCINLGVAQFITKPMILDDFLDVLKKVSKKASHGSTPLQGDRYTITLAEGVRWNTIENRMTHHNSMVTFTKNEQIVMEFLIDNIGHVCSVDALIEMMKAHQLDANHDSIRNMMSRLRKKLPDDTLKSVYGRGYHLMQIKGSL